MMLSFTSLSFYSRIFTFLLCSITCLVASAPTSMTTTSATAYHRRQIDLPFPYGKLADKILNVNDVAYMIDDREDDGVFDYPDYDYSIADLPAISILPPPPVSHPELPPAPSTITIDIPSFASRIPLIVKQVELETALVVLRTMHKVKGFMRRVVLCRSPPPPLFCLIV